jgi:hypothetical protein
MRFGLAQRLQSATFGSLVGIQSQAQVLQILSGSLHRKERWGRFLAMQAHAGAFCWARRKGRETLWPAAIFLVG